MNYVEGLDMNASHIAIILEQFNINSSGELKCRIPVLMPGIPSDGIIELNTRISTSSLLNKVKSDIKTNGKIATCNYLYIDVPQWIRRYFPSEDEYGNVSGNKKIIITFIGGDINHIRVIGRY